MNSPEHSPYSNPDLDRVNQLEAWKPIEDTELFPGQQHEVDSADAMSITDAGLDSLFEGVRPDEESAYSIIADATLAQDDVSGEAIKVVMFGYREQSGVVTNMLQAYTVDADGKVISKTDAKALPTGKTDLVIGRKTNLSENPHAIGVDLADMFQDKGMAMPPLLRSVSRNHLSVKTESNGRGGVVAVFEDLGSSSGRENTRIKARKLEENIDGVQSYADIGNTAVADTVLIDSVPPSSVDSIKNQSVQEQLNRVQAEMDELIANYSEEQQLLMWNYASGIINKTEAQKEGDGNASIYYGQQAGQALRDLSRAGLEQVASKYLSLMNKIEYYRARL